MQLFKQESTAQRIVEQTARTTIKTLHFALADRLGRTLAQAPTLPNQFRAENVALSAMILRERSGGLILPPIAMRLMGSCMYRALREERSRAERLGISPIIAEGLHASRLFAAGYDAGYRAAMRDVRNRITVDKPSTSVIHSGNGVSEAACDFQGE